MCLWLCANIQREIGLNHTIGGGRVGVETLSSMYTTQIHIHIFELACAGPCCVLRMCIVYSIDLIIPYTNRGNTSHPRDKTSNTNTHTHNYLECDDESAGLWHGVTIVMGPFQSSLQLQVEQQPASRQDHPHRFCVCFSYKPTFHHTHTTQNPFNQHTQFARSEQ